jgi:hypothetical protein
MRWVFEKALKTETLLDSRDRISWLGVQALPKLAKTFRHAGQ